MSRIGVATPRDDCPYAKSNDNTLALARAYRVFLTSCVGINLGDIPRGLRHPRDVPSVDPSTLGRKTLYELASLKYCYIAEDCSPPLIIGPPLPHSRMRQKLHAILGRKETETEVETEPYFLGSFGS